MTPPLGPQQGGYPQYPQSVGYPQYPGSYQQPSGSVARPWTVEVVFWIGVVVPIVATVLGVLNFVLAQHFVNQAIAAEMARGGAERNPARAAEVQHVISTVIVVISFVAFLVYLILTVLWIVFSFKLRAGRQWARVTLTVFASIWCLSGLWSVLQVTSGSSPMPGIPSNVHLPAGMMAVSLITGILALASMIAFLVLAFHRQSNGYFRYSRSLLANGMN